MVESVSELLTAILNESVDRIEVRAGTYMYTGNMNGTCSSAAICINRTLAIEAEVPGAVVFNAANDARVLRIAPGATVKLIGLNITGGFAFSVRCVLGFRTVYYLWQHSFGATHNGATACLLFLAGEWCWRLRRRWR